MKNEPQSDKMNMNKIKVMFDNSTMEYLYQTELELSVGDSVFINNKNDTISVAQVTETKDIQTTYKGPLKEITQKADIDEYGNISIPKGFKTAEDWSKDKWRIMAGEKASWINGIAYFSNKQIKAIHNYKKYPTLETPKNKSLYVERNPSEPVFFPDGSGYYPASGPCGPLYFDCNGET